MAPKEPPYPKLKHLVPSMGTYESHAVIKSWELIPRPRKNFYNNTMS